MSKISKTLRFEKDVIEHSEKNSVISSFPEWACSEYRKKFMNSESLKIDINKLEDILKKKKEEFKVMKKASSPDMLSNSERRWLLRTGLERVKSYSFEGVYQYFIRNFGRLDLNRRQFKLIIELLENENKTVYK